MKGCLMGIVKIFFSMILGFFLVLFFVFGGIDYVKSFFVPSQQQPHDNMSKAMKIADFSRIGNDFEILKTVDVIGANAVIANHKPSNQKIAFVNPGLILNLTKKDIKSDAIEQKLTGIVKNYENNVIKLEKLAVTQKGSIKALNQDIPYVKVVMKIQLPAGLDLSQNTEAVIGVASTPKGQNNIILSINKYGQYNHKITEKFFKKLRYNK